jgi:HK97 family phage portal protein
MASIIERAAETLGRAVGAYQKGVSQVLKRPAWIGSWAQSKRWAGGDYGRQWAQRRAFQNSWVFTAVNMIVREASAVTFGVVEQTDVDADVVAVDNHPFERVLHRPNPWIGRSFLWQYSIAWLQLDGNAYWYVGCDAYGQPREIWPLPSDHVEVRPGDEEQFIDHYEYRAHGHIYKIPAAYVVHFRLPNPFDIFRGLSPLTAAILAADSDTAMARWNGTFFGRDNVMPSAIINLGSGDPRTPVNPADAERLKHDLRTSYTAAARKTAVTTVQKLDIALLGWNPKDMDFIEGRQFTKEEIFLIYGIPGGLMDKNATEANSNTADRVFKEKTIWPLLTLIAEELTAELIIPFYGSQYRGVFDDIRPSNRELELQEDQAARETLTIDERRQRFWQLPPLPDGRGDLTVLELRIDSQGVVDDQYPSFSMENLLPAKAGADGKPLAAVQEAAWTVLDVAEQAAQDDLRRWRDKAVKAFKNKRAPNVSFDSVAIPPDVSQYVEGRLQVAQSLDEVKAAFDVSAPEVSQYVEGRLQVAQSLDEVNAAFDVSAPEVAQGEFFRGEGDLWQESP